MPDVVCAHNKISGETEKLRWKIGLESNLSQVDEFNKFIIINYGGNFAGDWGNADNMKSFGFSLKNPNEEEINFESYDYCRMKVPFKNLSDVSEMYFCYEEQKIKISVL